MMFLLNIKLKNSPFRFEKKRTDKKRAEGKDHNHALRCLARQLIKVIFKMLTENREYIYKEELKKAA